MIRCKMRVSRGQTKLEAAYSNGRPHLDLRQWRRQRPCNVNGTNLKTFILNKNKPHSAYLGHRDECVGGEDGVDGRQGQALEELQLRGRERGAGQQQGQAQGKHHQRHHAADARHEVRVPGGRGFLWLEGSWGKKPRFHYPCLTLPFWPNL